MPKKKNFMGAMQNYNAQNGEYEPALKGPNGESPSSFKSFKKSDEKKTFSPNNLPKKNQTVRIAKEFGDNTREFEVVDVKDGIKGITIKEKGRDGLTYNVDVSQLEGYSNGEPLDKKVFDKTGFEEINNKRMGKPNTENDKMGKWKEQYNKAGFFQLDKEKYPDVEQTSYGFIYNVNGKNITDIAAQNKMFGMPGGSGFSVEIGGDESFYETFDEAYKAAKGGK